MLGASTSTGMLQAISRNDRFAGTRQLLKSLDETLSSLAATDRTEVLAARDLSLSVHLRQKDRPDGTPYIDHPLRVTLTVVHKFGLRDRDVLIAGLLHDSVEDQPEGVIALLRGSPTAHSNKESQALLLIGERFGTRVSEMVGHLTTPDFSEMVAQAQLRGDQRSDKAITAELYKEHFLVIFEKDPQAFLIKLSDFSENAFAIGRLPEGPKKEWLREKYGPVIMAVLERLRQIPPMGHFLSAFQESLSTELADVYARDYGASE